MRILGVIPARYASERFPGKPLADIAGKPMIQRVYEQARLATALTDVLIATDDARILQAAETFHGRAVMTSSTHESGTERIIEVASNLSDYDAYINIQGDEPFIAPEQINQVADLFRKGGPQTIATLVREVTDESAMQPTSIVKVVRNTRGEALYFSRAVIPYARHTRHQPLYHHVGIYGYSTLALQHISGLSPSPLEQTEGLEQLRWLEHGMTIRTAITAHESWSVDLPEDVQKVIRAARGSHES
ncbi:MAG: 3-deoxy-manno-octulosonate cytidylyltransferase [Bacteroidota bacterium]